MCELMKFLTTFNELDVHFSRVNLHDTCAGLLVGVWELNLAVQTSCDG